MTAPTNPDAETTPSRAVVVSDACSRCGGSGTVIIGERDGDAFWNRCVPCECRSINCENIVISDCDSCVANQLVAEVLRGDVIRLFKENTHLKKRIAQLIKHRGHMAAEVVMDKLAEEFPSENNIYSYDREK